MFWCQTCDIGMSLSFGQIADREKRHEQATGSEHVNREHGERCNPRCAFDPGDRAAPWAYSVVVEDPYSF